MLISTDVAMNHLYAEEADRDQVARKLESAIAAAEDFMGRRLFASAEDLSEAIAQAETDVQTVIDKDAQILADTTAAPAIKALRAEANLNTFHRAKMVMNGVLINPAIETGILLILGDLYKNRENSVDGGAAELPMGARFYLQPYRIMGL